MEPRKDLSPLTTSSPPFSAAGHAAHMPFMSQRHPPPPPLDLRQLPPHEGAVSSAGASAELPPPLPPRVKREYSAGGGSGSELSSPVTTTTPPTEDTAPPLPPRQRNLNSILNRSLGITAATSPISSQTLPRERRIPLHNNAVMTLPRRNSERDHLASAQPQFVNVNGGAGGGGERGGSVTPELPPKTYRSVIHSRQQSS